MNLKRIYRFGLHRQEHLSIEEFYANATQIETHCVHHSQFQLISFWHTVVDWNGTRMINVFGFIGAAVAVDLILAKRTHNARRSDYYYYYYYKIRRRNLFGCDWV